VEDDACNISSLVHDDLSPRNAMSGAPHIHNDTQGAEGCSEMEATSEEWKRNDTHANNTPDHRTAASTLLGNIATLEHGELAPGSYPVQQQGNSTAGITNWDLETLKGTQHINNCIATTLLWTICLDYLDVHIASSHFLEKLRITDWSQAKTFFHNRIDEANGNLSNWQLWQASLDAPVLIFPVHGSLHWNALIRDSCRVGLEKAWWQYFDTKFTVEQLKWVKDTITNSQLWKEGMMWETVVMPQKQVNDDCGFLMGAIAVGFVHWSACVTNCKHLNSNDLQVRNKMNPIQLRKVARTFARQAITQKGDCQWPKWMSYHEATVSRSRHDDRTRHWNKFKHGYQPLLWNHLSNCHLQYAKWRNQTDLIPLPNNTKRRQRLLLWTADYLYQ